MAISFPSRTEIQPDIWLDARRAVWLEELRLLVVADLHWGYADSHRAQGNLLPVWGDGDIAARLDALLADYRPREMIWLGDSLHTLAGRTAAEKFLLLAGVETTVLAGNHDRRWSRVAAQPGYRRNRFFFHHGDAGLPVPETCLEVLGHHHPAAAWSDGAGGRLKMPALVASTRRLILPAFSPWAAGVPWNGRLRAGETLWAITGKRIFAMPRPAAPLAELE